MIREALQAAQAQLVATLNVLDVALAALDEKESGICRHEQKVDIATQTTPGKWYCPACRASGDTATSTQGGLDHG